MFTWARTLETSSFGSQAVMWIGRAAATNEFCAIRFQNSGNIRATVTSWGGTGIAAEIPGGWNVGEWYPILAIYEEQRVEVYTVINGRVVTAFATDSGTRDNSSFGRIAVGYNADSSPNAHFRGDAAHMSMWNRRLTPSEIHGLLQGDVPNEWHPGGLEFYHSGMSPGRPIGSGGYNDPHPNHFLGQPMTVMEGGLTTTSPTPGHIYDDSSEPPGMIYRSKQPRQRRRVWTTGIAKPTSDGKYPNKSTVLPVKVVETIPHRSPVANTRIKPAQIALSISDVAPEWRWFWRKLSFFVLPSHRGGETPRIHYVNGVYPDTDGKALPLTSYGSGAWKENKTGRAWDNVGVSGLLARNDAYAASGPNMNEDGITVGFLGVSPHDGGMCLTEFRYTSGDYNFGLYRSGTSLQYLYYDTGVSVGGGLTVPDDRAYQIVAAESAETRFMVGEDYATGSGITLVNEGAGVVIGVLCRWNNGENIRFECDNGDVELAWACNAALTKQEMQRVRDAGFAPFAKAQPRRFIRERRFSKRMPRR